MALTPDNAPTSLIEALHDIASGIKPAATVPELFFNTKARHRYVYDRVPVGHDTGYRCYDGSKHDADSAFQSGEYGDGLSENEAYADLMKDEVPPRTKTVDAGRFEPNEVISAGSPSEWERDDE